MAPPRAVTSILFIIARAQSVRAKENPPDFPTGFLFK